MEHKYQESVGAVKVIPPPSVRYNLPESMVEQSMTGFKINTTLQKVQQIKQNIFKYSHNRSSVKPFFVNFWEKGKSIDSLESKSDKSFWESVDSSSGQYSADNQFSILERLKFPWSSKKIVTFFNSAVN